MNVSVNLCALEGFSVHRIYVDPSGRTTKMKTRLYLQRLVYELSLVPLGPLLLL